MFEDSFERREREMEEYISDAEDEQYKFWQEARKSALIKEHQARPRDAGEMFEQEIRMGKRFMGMLREKIKDHKR